MPKDEGTDTNDNSASDEQKPTDMDEIIEQEADAELDKARGKGGASDESEQTDSKSDEANDSDAGQDEQSDSESEDDTEQDAEQADTEADVEAEDEDEDAEAESESKPVDSDSFIEQGVEAFSDEYKPDNWAGFAKDIVNAVRGEVAKEQKTISEQQEAYDKEVNSIQEQWNSEIEELTKSGDLPKDSKARAKEVKATYDWMAEHNKKHEQQPNKQIWSIEAAQKIRSGTRVSKEREAEIKERRAARSGNISGGGSNEGTARRTPTKGMSMDDIIADVEDSELLG